MNAEGFGEVHPSLFGRDGEGMMGRDFLAGRIENPFGDGGLFGSSSGR